MMKRFFILLVCLSIPLFGSSAYVFDFGGVLADADRQVIRNYLLKSLDLTDEELDAAILEWRAARKAGSSEEAFWSAFARSRGFELPDDWFVCFDRAKMEAIRPNQGVIALVQSMYCQGYRLGMLSNIREDEASIIRALGYYAYFDPVLLSYGMNCDKPNPCAYQRLIDALCLPPAEIFFVDDEIQNVEAALKVGIDAIQFKDAGHLRKALIERGVSF